MLSSMETANGLMVVGPKGQPKRLTRGSPAYHAAKEILQQSLPAEQAWQKLQDLLANPLESVISWCARFGMRLGEEDSNLRFQDFTLNRTQWLPLFNRSVVAAGNPGAILHLAEKLGAAATNAQVSNLCLHWHDLPTGKQLGVVQKIMLPREAKVGDLVTDTTSGPEAGLVSYGRIGVRGDGELVLENGMVIAVNVGTKLADEICAGPGIMGYNRTYRCEEGTVDGWLEDFSYDSLPEARANAREIQETGSEVRIINRLSGLPVALE